MSSQQSEHDDTSEWKSAGREVFGISLVSLSWQPTEPPTHKWSPPRSVGHLTPPPPAAEAQYGSTKHWGSPRSLLMHFSDTTVFQTTCKSMQSKSSKQSLLLCCSRLEDIIITEDPELKIKLFKYDIFLFFSQFSSGAFAVFNLASHCIHSKAMVKQKRTLIGTVQDQISVWDRLHLPSFCVCSSSHLAQSAAVPSC